MDTELLSILVSLADTGSLKATADAFKLSRATLRRRIEALEAQAGRPLVASTAQGTALTPAGRRLASRARPLVSEVRELLNTVRLENDALSGELRVLIPVGLPPQVFAPIVDAIGRRFADLRLTLHETRDARREPVEDYELILALGTLDPGPGWICEDLLVMPERLIASPRYLARAGTPASVEELAAHALLAWQPPGRDPRRWPLAGGASLAVSPVVSSPNVHIVRELAIAGLGVALVPDALLPDPHHPPGSVVAVLPGEVGGTLPLRVVMTPFMAAIPGLRELLDMVRQLVERVRAQ